MGKHQSLDDVQIYITVHYAKMLQIHGKEVGNMLVEVKKVPSKFVDKKTGEQRNVWHYYLYAPSGKGIQIRNVFKEDNGVLALLIPFEGAKSE